ncbi:amino acid adenylation domain-containing protein [Longimicrobium sp.]|uniref:amino acid adenylation domain-containing protein n=1 Tax=Longimicrobium sp. TaxID=2029185 RepID=UPI002E32D365|nr:amino acid adenylation domain-containing protein [Longimicrobium sp.]HEX6038739.1 amino acid adenylation domain-containing protein [Longimicrobium sp.]
MSTQDLVAKRAALSDTKRALLERRLRGDAAAAKPRDTIGRVAGPGPEHPASFAQERMWFLTGLDPDKPLYNVPVAMLVPADVDVPLLERALSEVVRRHEALRTSFRMGDDGQLLQIVHEPFAMKVDVVEARHRVGDRFADSVNDLVAEEGARPFDLSHPPLFRVTLLRVTDDDFAMVTTTHHIVTDGWAYPMMNREILECYGAWKEGREPQLPPVELRYADYTVWQREQLQGENLQRQVAYWRDVLDGAPAIELPTDRPRPAVASQRGHFHRFRLDAALADRLRELCKREAATLNMVLMAAFYALLQRYTGQDDMVVGTLLGNRPRKELEDIIGVFVNTAALRVRLDGDPSFREAIARTRRAVLDADRNQDLPFEKLVDELGVSRDMSRHPVFQVLYFHHVYAHSHHAMDVERAPAIDMRPVHPDHDADLIDTGVAKFDLMLATMEARSGLTGVFEYATDLFDEATMARMERHYALLLDAVSRDPDAPVSSHVLTTDEERRRLLEDWGTGPSVPVPAAPVHRRFAARAAATPDAVAVVSGGERITYGALDAWSDRVAGALRAAGAAPGRIVGIHVDRTAGMVAGIMGILKTGAAYLPLDPVYPPERIAYMVDDSGAALVLADDPSFSAAVPVVALPSRPAPGESVDAVSVDVASTDRAYLIYTSGSTGRPKAVELEHGTLSSMLAGTAHTPGMAPDDVTLAVTTISFDVAVPELLLPLVTGARIVVASRDDVVDAAALDRLIQAEGVTVMAGTPATFRMLVQSGWTGSDQLRVLPGGEALTSALAEDLIARTAGVWNMYGPSEATVYSTVHHVTEPGPGMASIGRPFPNARIYVLDERMRPVPVGIPGELYVGGAGVGRGYLGRPELTSERFVPDPFAGGAARMYRTGDRARWAADGTLTFMGRLDGQVKLRGYRIELGEVESELLRHPSVRAAAAAIREDVPGDPRLVAYVVGRDGAAPATSELRALLRERLPEYMVPGAFVALDALPLTGTGKVDRRALPAPDLQADADADAYVGPRNVVEDMLAEIWAEVLRRERIGVHENFFAIGGHSLLATQALVRIREAFEVDLPIRTFFAAPTIEGVAAAIEAAGSPVLARMMDEMEGLSAEDIEALLAEEG